MKLNDAQQKAVTAPDGPALVLAGAGSGKTRVIVERIVWLIQERGVRPREILALTFTNKAADEMKSRIRARLGLEKLDAWVGTFHSFGLFLLRREIERLGRPSSFTIFDDTDQLGLIKRLIKALGERWAPVSPREALSWISRLKQDLETPADKPITDDPAEETYRELWTRYHDALERASAVDFDDLIVLPARILTEFPEARDKFRLRYRHILVDEYQDTNRAQYVIARTLAGDGGNLFVVGDEDQGIYSWRGATIGNILDFPREFANTATFRLEQNYRSMKPILDAANSVVAHNQKRLGKNLWTAQEGGERVTFFLAGDAEDEAAYVVDTIAKKGYEPKETAVLFRTNGQARLMEDAMRRKGLPYLMLGGMRFYARKEIKDVLCYLRLALHTHDDESFRRIINVPARGFGSAAMERIEVNARLRGMSLFAALREAVEEGDIAVRTRDAAATFLKLIDEAAERAASPGVKAVVDLVLNGTGYRDYVEKSDEKDFRSRLEVLDEFVSACAAFDATDGGTLLEFLNSLSLQADTDDLRPGAPAVTLMTCHSAKGLEYDHVFLIGLEEGLLPHATALDDDDEIEEERRLCYVSMTRARKTLALTAARSRVHYGERGERQVSRFIDEIPEKALDRVDRMDAPASARSAPTTAPSTDASKLIMGVRVRHARFGTGTVMYTSGSGPKASVRIRFDTGMARQFVISMAPLEILEKSRR